MTARGADCAHGRPDAPRRATDPGPAPRPATATLRTLGGAILLLAVCLVTVAALRAEPADSGAAPGSGAAAVPEEPASVEELRAALERERAAREEERKLALQPHKQNYALPLTIDARDHRGRQAEEATFQISLKKRLFRRFPLYVGLTQTSFWQIYDVRDSRPFRTSDYNPELFLDFRGAGWGGWPLGARFGFEHESNGEGGETSRSWTRLYVWPELALDPLTASLKVWYVVPKRRGDGQYWDPVGDDDPDLEDYLGHFELHLRYAFAGENRVTLMVRKGALDPSGTYRLEAFYHPQVFVPGISFYLQYFNGFGESLFDFDRRVNKVGVGLAFD